MDSKGCFCSQQQCMYQWCCIRYITIHNTQHNISNISFVLVVYKYLYSNLHILSWILLTWTWSCFSHLRNHVATPPITVLKSWCCTMATVSQSCWASPQWKLQLDACPAPMPVGGCIATYTVSTHTHNSHSLITGLTCLRCSCLYLLCILFLLKIVVWGHSLTFQYLWSLPQWQVLDWMYFLAIAGFLWQIW